MTDFNRMIGNEMVHTFVEIMKQVDKIHLEISSGEGMDEYVDQNVIKLFEYAEMQREYIGQPLQLTLSWFHKETHKAMRLILRCDFMDENGNVIQDMEDNDTD